MPRSSTAHGSTRSSRVVAWGSSGSTRVAKFGSSVVNIEATPRCNIYIYIYMYVCIYRYYVIISIGSDIKKISQLLLDLKVIKNTFEKAL
jgi:hypothetical protein